MSIQLKTLLILLIGLCIVSSKKTCHKSCTCDEDTFKCNGCKDPYGDPDQLWYYDYRYCPCLDGYYVSDVNNWTCSPNPIAEDFDWCQEQLVYQILQIIVNTSCHMEIIDGVHYAVSIIDMDYNGMVQAAGCLDQFRSKVLYKDPKQTGHPYKAFPDGVVIELQNATQLRVQILLNDIADKYSLANSVDNSKNTINNEIHLGLYIGHDRRDIRLHEFIMHIFTNRDQVQVFSLDIDMQRTTDDCDGCIIIADLDVYSKVYTDDTYSTVKSSLQYVVGEWFYAEVKFKDATYTKKLLFETLFFKTDDNEVFNMSHLVNPTPISGGLRFKMQLIYPTSSALIQVSMKIEGVNRFLAATTQIKPTDSVQQQFTASILNKNNSAESANQKSSNNSASLLVLSLFAFLLLLF